MEDITIDKPRIERTLVPYPHCDTLHDGRTWSTVNGTAFKNWFGLYCPHCGDIIPCLTNVLSFLILAVTFPIWGGFKNRLKAMWLEQQPQRYENIDVEHFPDPFNKKNWMKTGLSWGFFLIMIIAIGLPFIKGKEIAFQLLWIYFIIWMMAVPAFGYKMKSFLNKTCHLKRLE